MSGLNMALEAITRKTDDLFVFEIEGLEVVFRLPSVRLAQQYNLLLEMSTSEHERVIIYESIFRNVIEDDWLASNAADLKAGIPETVGRLVLLLSGMDSHSKGYTEQLFNLYRSETESTLMYMKRFICQVFVGYTFESLDLLNYQQLVNVFIQAEKVLLDKGIIEQEHDFKSPKESKTKPFGVEEMIRNDGQAFSEFERPTQENPQAQEHMRKIREEAIKRAKEEEKKYRQAMAKRVG